MGQMVLDKLITAVDEAMQTLEGSMRVKLAHLQPRTLWDHTGRADLMGDEVGLFSIELLNPSVF